MELSIYPYFGSRFGLYLGEEENVFLDVETQGLWQLGDLQKTDLNRSLDDLGAQIHYPTAFLTGGDAPKTDCVMPISAGVAPP